MLLHVLQVMFQLLPDVFLDISIKPLELIVLHVLIHKL